MANPAMWTVPLRFSIVPSTPPPSRVGKSNHTFSHRGFILTWDGRLDNRDELIA